MLKALHLFCCILFCNVALGQTIFNINQVTSFEQDLIPRGNKIKFKVELQNISPQDFHNLKFTIN